MLRSVVNRIKQKLAESPDGRAKDNEAGLQLATAALMVEMSRADSVERRIEKDLIKTLLREKFSLDDESLAELFGSASDKVEEIVSLHELTSVLHRELDDEEKEKLLEMLWRVAYADKELDPEEDALVRKVAGLLYVRNTRLMKIRNRVRKKPTNDETAD